MPFLDSKKGTPVLGPVGQLPEPAPVYNGPAPSFFHKTIPAAFRTENSVGSLLSMGGAPGALWHTPIDKNFDPFAGLEGTRYQPYLDQFVFANTTADVLAVKRQIDREAEDRKTIARSGWAGVAANFAAGLFDPVNLIPVGGEAYRVGKIGGDILKGALVTARAGLLASTATEALMQGSQLTRTANESITNIGMATFLGGVLGGSVGAVRRAAEVRGLGNQHDAVKTPNSDGTVGGKGVVEIGLGNLEEGLSKVKFDEGSGHLQSNGSVKLDKKYGMVKVVWKHGEKSGNSNPAGYVTREDVTAFPYIARRFKGEALSDKSKGHQEWRWVINRPASDGTMRPVLYSIRRFLHGDNKDHVVTVFVPGKPDKYNLSVRRPSFLDKLKRAVNPKSPLSDGSESGIPQGGVPINAPKGRDGSAPRDSISHPDPFASQVTAWDNLKARIADSLTTRKNDPMEPGSIKISEEDLLKGKESTVGSVFVRYDTKKMKGALGIEKLIKLGSPMIRTAMSKSFAVRDITQSLVDTPFYYEKNAEGIASNVPVETLVKRWEANKAEAFLAVEDAFVRYRFGQSKSLKLNAATITTRDILPGGKAFRGDQLSWKAFRDEVSRAARRGDTHPIKEVADAAKAVRATVLDPLKNEAIKAGNLPEDVGVSTAASYLMRVYDVGKIVRQRPEFIDRAVQWLQQQKETVSARVEERQAALDHANAQLSAMPDTVKKAQSDAKTFRAAWKKARQHVTAAQRKLAVAKRLAKTAEADRNLALKRAKAFTPTTEMGRTDPLAQALKDLQTLGTAKHDPQGLTAWLVSKGGLREDGGELKHMGITPKSRPGLINSKAGQSFDDAALHAWESGFFPDRGSRPDINTFLEALREDFNGTPVVRQGDLEKLAYNDYLASLDRSIHDVGLDPATATAAKVQAAFDAAEKGAKSKYRKATPAAKARAREIDFYKRRAEKRLTQANKRLKEAHTAQDKAIVARNAARDRTAQALKASEFVDRKHHYLKRKSETLKNMVDGEKAFATASESDLADIANQITDTITGAPEGRIPYETARLARGPLKERTFGIPDVMIEDFLVNDIEEIIRRYVNTMAPDVELTKMFGSPDMSFEISKIKDSYNRAMNKDIPVRQRQNLEKAMRADIRDITAMRDRLRGTYARPADPYSPAVRVFSVARNWNFLRLLGGMTISALSDVAAPLVKHGLMRVIKTGLIPLVINLHGIKMAGAEAKMAGTALDMVLNSRAMNLAELGHDFSRRTKFESGVRGMTDNFGLVTLMAPWNAAMKQWVGAISGTRILQEAINWAGKTIKPDNIEHMAMLGIDEHMARRIGEQFAAHGQKEGGVWMAGTKKWTDGEAVTAFRAALVKDIDRIIVTPGIGDRPLWMSSELGKTIGQFKAFSYSSMTRTLLAGLQQRDAKVLSGMILMTTLGMGVYALKEWQSGRKTSDNPGVWLAKGIDKAGLTGWFFDLNNLADSTLGVGVYDALGGQASGRYSQMNPLSEVFGPTGGLIKDTFGVGASAFNGKPWRKSDTHRLRRLAPWQNLFYVRGLFDRTEAGINAALGAKGKGH